MQKIQILVALLENAQDSPRNYLHSHLKTTEKVSHYCI